MSLPEYRAPRTTSGVLTADDVIKEVYREIGPVDTITLRPDALVGLIVNIVERLTERRLDDLEESVARLCRGD